MEENLLENYIDYELKKVKVKILKDFDPISFYDKKYGPFLKDNYIEIPRALAKILAKEGITEYPLPSLTPTEIRKILFYEGRNKELKKLDENFYLEANELIYLAKEKIINEDVNELKRNLQEICQKRLEKILKFLMFLEDYTKILNLLTNEEKYLVIHLSKILKDWFENVLNQRYLKKF